MGEEAITEEIEELEVEEAKLPALAHIKQLGEEYLRTVEERDEFEARRKSIAGRLMSLLKKIEQEKAEFKQFTVSIKPKRTVTGWKFADLERIFGTDAVESMTIRTIDRNKLKARLEELKEKEGIQLHEDNFAIKETLSEYIEVKRKSKSKSKKEARIRRDEER